MRSILINGLLLFVAIISSIVLLQTMATDAYGPAWGVAFFLAGFFAIIGAIIWKLFTFVSGYTFWLTPRHKTSDKTRPTQTPITKYIPTLFLCGAVLYAICYFIGTGCVDPREGFWKWGCRNNLKSISLALHNYEQAHGCFPPAYIADEMGKPMHSWRVLLLPYLGDWDNNKNLYKQYDFNERWDGPYNRKLIENVPHEYLCPEDEYSKSRNHKPGSTSYVAILGDEAAWRGDKSMTFDDMHGGTSNTVWLVEVAESDIAWTEPRDISLAEIDGLLKSSSGTRISPKHRLPQTYFFNPTPGGINVSHADGSVSFIPANHLTPEALEKTLTIGGYPDKFVYDGPYNFVNWWNCGVLLTFVLSVYLLLRRAARDDVSKNGSFHEDQWRNTNGIRSRIR